MENPLENFWQCLLTPTTHLPCRPAVPPPGTSPRGTRTCGYQGVCRSAHSGFIYNSPEVETPPVFISGRTYEQCRSVHGYYTARRGMNCPVNQGVGLINITELKKPDSKRVNTVWFPLQEAQEQARLICGDGSQPLLPWRGRDCLLFICVPLLNS